MVLRAWGQSQYNDMASREKKARSVTADSPTPSLGSANSGSNSNISVLAPTTPSGNTATTSGNDSAPTTPTSTRKGAATGAGTANSTSAVSGNASGSGSSSTSISTTRGSLSRLKSKQQLLQQNATGGDETGAVEDTGTVDTIVTTPSRTTRGGASREDSAGRDSPATFASSKDKDDTGTSALSVNASKDVTKSPAIGARRATAKTSSSAPVASKANVRKNRVVSLKRTTLLKRKGKKIIGKPMLGRKVVARRQLVAAAKSTGTRGAPVVVVKKEVVSPSTASSSKEKEEDLLSTPSLRNGKPRNSDSPVAKRKSAAVLKQDSKSLDSLTGGGSSAIKMERRRSGSVSKCSDMTDDGDGTGGAEMKRELFDYESRSKMLDKMAEAFNERKAGGGASPVVGGGSKEDKGQTSGGTLRRSMRQRKSTAREKEDFLSPRGKAGSSMDIKIEPAESFESLSVDGDGETVMAVASVAAPLTIDTTETEVSIGTEQLHSDGAA
uniref:Uncharacterized protein n=1 Tax=Anopheles maculatus TaxID=74869 RepID=A0A182T4N1_9DIPT